MKKHIFASVLCLCLFAVLLCACGETPATATETEAVSETSTEAPDTVAELLTFVDASVSRAKSVTASVTVAEEGTAVYEQSRTVKPAGEDTIISVTEGAFDKNFEYSTTVTIDTVKTGTVDFLPITLDRDAVTDASVGEDGTTVCTVKSSALTAEGAETLYTVPETVFVTFVTEGDNLASVGYAFDTVSGRTVTVLYTFAY